jgi:hypothetical protein
MRARRPNAGPWNASSTSPVRFRPYGDGHALLHAGLGCDFYLKRCQAREEGTPCDGRCINAVGVDAVFDATMARAVTARPTLS